MIEALLILAVLFALALVFALAFIADREPEPGKTNPFGEQ